MHRIVRSVSPSDDRACALQVDSVTGERETAGYASLFGELGRQAGADPKLGCPTAEREIVALHESPKICRRHHVLSEAENGCRRHVERIVCTLRDGRSVVDNMNGVQQCRVLPQRSIELHPEQQWSQIYNIEAIIAGGIVPHHLYVLAAVKRDRAKRCSFLPTTALSISLFQLAPFPLKKTMFSAAQATASA